MQLTLPKMKFESKNKKKVEKTRRFSFSLNDYAGFSWGKRYRRNLNRNRSNVLCLVFDTSGLSETPKTLREIMDVPFLQDFRRGGLWFLQVPGKNLVTVSG